MITTQEIRRHMHNMIYNCLICKKGLYSGLGAGCKMCGMPLNKKNEEFCSRKCKKKYNKINKRKK